MLVGVTLDVQCAFQFKFDRKSCCGGCLAEHVLRRFSVVHTRLFLAILDSFDSNEKSIKNKLVSFIMYPFDLTPTKQPTSHPRLNPFRMLGCSFDH